ncbi:hypothetical protein QVD17_27021 [Tagetes erecta]|uniref:CASP-like protein n=1 Tax=Tagetes erecta TaxID=13708 RepID=A0AAD8NRC0_TARER|nr:hypothetical protein QVD17_27021 [Tagetes erecta]
MEAPMKHSFGYQKNQVIADVALRALLFVTSLGAIIVLVTSKQSKMIPISPTVAIPLDANWNQSPANIYFVAAHCVACLYSIITCASSISVLKKIGTSSEKLQSNFVKLDSLLLGIISSAAGAAAAVAYIGLKGNSHARWNEICNVYGSFCHHVVVAILLSLMSTGSLLPLVWSPSTRIQTKS